MVLISKVSPGCSSKAFEAEIWTIDESTKKVSLTYKPLLNINNIRQVAKFRQIDETVIDSKVKKSSDSFVILAPNTKTKVTFEFEFTPEYIEPGCPLLINDSLLKVYGVITKTF